MIHKIIDFIFSVISLSFLRNSKSKIHLPSESTTEATNAIDVKIQVNLSSKILINTISLLKYLEEHARLILTENNELHLNIQKIKQENNSNKLKIQTLEQEASSLNKQLDESRTLIREVRTRNTHLAQQTEQLTQKIELLESHKKALVQELGGAIGKEDLEYATWDLVLQTTKLLIEERDKAIAENKLLHEKNQLLTKTINNL